MRRAMSSGPRSSGFRRSFRCLDTGSPVYYGVDHLGSVRRAFASTSSAPNYAFDAYGIPLQTTAPLTQFGYAGLLNHSPSGLSLATYRAYDPVSGRWLSRDPIQENGGINLYAYVDEQPTVNKDPTGLAPKYTPRPQSSPNVQLCQQTPSRSECASKCADLALPTTDYGVSFQRCMAACLSNGNSGFPKWDKSFP